MRKCNIDGFKHIEILDSDWYNGCLFTHQITKDGQYHIGIVTCKDTITGEISNYIGLGIGIDQMEDEDLIVATGRHFPNY